MMLSSRWRDKTNMTSSAAEERNGNTGERPACDVLAISDRLRRETRSRVADSRYAELRRFAERNWQGSQFIPDRLVVDCDDLATQTAIQVDNQRSAEIDRQHVLVSTDDSQDVSLLDGG